MRPEAKPPTHFRYRGVIEVVGEDANHGIVKVVREILSGTRSCAGLEVQHNKGRILVGGTATDPRMSGSLSVGKSGTVLLSTEKRPSPDGSQASA